METVVQFFVLEWINIALEYTAVAWTRLPRLGIAVVAVNLATHPIFTFLLGAFGRNPVFVISCEVVIFFAESAMLIACYGFKRWRFLALTAFIMNAASYCTGLLM